MIMMNVLSSDEFLYLKKIDSELVQWLHFFFRVRASERLIVETGSIFFVPGQYKSDILLLKIMNALGKGWGIINTQS